MLIIMLLFAVLSTILCLHHISLCCTGETTKERIKGNVSAAKCYFFHIKPQKFNSQFQITEEQAQRIKGNFIEIEISDNEQSLSN
jgi:hypothetical protein